MVKPERLKEDLRYVDQMSFWLDVKYIWQTAYCVLVKTWIVSWQERRAVRAEVAS